MLGRPPHLVAADAAFYSAKNEAAAKAKGVKRVCIPNRSTKSPERKREQKKRWFRLGLFALTTSAPRNEQARTEISSQTWRSLDVWSGLQRGSSTEFTMSTTQKDKSSGKPRQRSRKADQRSQKTEAPQGPKLDQEIEDQISSLMADAPTNDAAPPAQAPLIDEVAPAEVPLIDEVAPADAPSIGPATPAQHRPIGIQNIANAYEDYAKRSLEESRSFVEKLMGVRSLDKAIEVQTEFARQAYVNFVTELQRICELYNELARQIFRPWERFAAEVTQKGR